jgi:hypothetical protein
MQKPWKQLQGFSFADLIVSSGRKLIGTLYLVWDERVERFWGLTQDLAAFGDIGDSSQL